MEDAGLVCLLIADHVGSPAQEGPEVHVRVRGVADPALPRAGLVGGGGQQGGGQRVVEDLGKGRKCTVKIIFTLSYFDLGHFLSSSWKSFLAVPRQLNR